MVTKRLVLLLIVTASLAAWFGTLPAQAQLRPSSQVLLPYFEVDLGGTGKTTLMSVGNVLDQPVPIQIEVRSNWGIVVATLNETLNAHEVRSFNLRDWVVQGKLPNRATMRAADQAQLQAALAGKQAPQDNLFYSTSVSPNLAVGSVMVRTSGKRQAALWGDFLLVNQALNVSEGDNLVNLDGASECPGPNLCEHHALRFISSAGVNADTEVVIWTQRSVSPAKTPYPDSQKIGLNGLAYNEAGQVIGGVNLRLLPLQVVTVGSLGLKEPFGWLDIKTDAQTFIGVHFNRGKSDGAALQAYCLPDGGGDDVTPGLKIEKRTNGQDADAAPGPSIPVGSPVLWEYVVSNTGDLLLSNIDVSDDQGVKVTCPRTKLAPGESMTCTGKGTAVACQYENIGFAVASPPSGPDLTASDPSHYFGTQNAKIDIEKSTNGEDADTAPGPTITVGSPVNWTYKVTNTGDVNLTAVKVTDDKGVAVTCPKTSLRPGESMTCTGKGTAVEGPYVNVGTVTAKDSCDQTVTDSDSSHYTGEGVKTPGISIKKYTNGEDADTAPGPTLNVGAPVQWTYIVKNTGNVALSAIKVTDNKGVAVTCPKTSLAAGEAMTCTGNGTATLGQYENIGSVVGTPPSGSNVTSSDPSHYLGKIPDCPAISIKKYTNGEDADTAPGPTINVGAPVQWTYIVKNTGNVALSAIKVTDNKGVAVTCPKASLAVGETMTCTGNGTATLGQYENIGSVVGTPPSGSNVTSSDPSHYLGKDPDRPAISIKKYTNGEDADTAPGPTINVGSPVQWTYIVKNTGNVTLSSVKVTDDKGVAVSCPKATLAAGETMTCTGNGTATAGQYENIGSVAGTPPSRSNVTSSDPSHYYGQIPPPPPGDEGCTPGYWKNHTNSWPPTGYLPSQTVKSVFSQAALYPSLGSSTLLGALSFQGGSTLEGAAGNLLRAATAALLDASHPGVDYPRTPASVISDTNSALASGNRDTMLGLASRLDADNNLGCPLN